MNDRQRKAMFAKMNQGHSGLHVSDIDSTKTKPPPLTASQKRMHESVVHMINKNHVLTKQEMDFAKNTINRLAHRGDRRLDPPIVKALLDASWSQSEKDGIKLDSEFQRQGFDWLKKKKRQMGYRELNVLENAKEIRMNGFHDNGNLYSPFYVPNYNVIANDGSSFEYHIENGELAITG